MTCYCTAPPEPALALSGNGCADFGCVLSGEPLRKNSLCIDLGPGIVQNGIGTFISLEEFAGFEALWEKMWKQDFSDVLYLCRQGSFNWMKLRAMVCSVGQVDYDPAGSLWGRSGPDGARGISPF